MKKVIREKDLEAQKDEESNYAKIRKRKRKENIGSGMRRLKKTKEENRTVLTLKLNHSKWSKKIVQT